MGFFKQIVKDLAADYISERGAKGALEDLGSIASGVKNFFSSEGDSSNEGDSLNDTYRELIDQEEYQQAIDFIKQYYQGEKKDYLYYFYIGNAQYNKGLNEDDIQTLDTAKQNLQTSYNNCAVGTEDSEFIKNLYNEVVEMRDLVHDRKVTKEYIDNACDKGDYNKAIEKWNKFNNKHFHGEKDFAYYEKIVDIHIHQLIMTDDAEKDFEVIDDILSKMNSVVTDENEREGIQEWRNLVYSMKSDKRVAQHRNKGDYDKAIAEIEDQYATNVNKTEEYWYWSGLFRNYYDAISCNMLIGKNRDEDISMLRRSLSQMERLDDGSHAESIAIDRQNMENLLAAQPSSPTSISESTGEVSSEAEDEYMVELKECYADGEITDRERRLLEKLRKSLGISEERAKELEAICNPSALTKEEEEYANELREVLTDGVITDKERRLLTKLAASLNISEQRAAEIERMLSEQA